MLIAEYADFKNSASKCVHGNSYFNFKRDMITGKGKTCDEK